LLGKFTRYQQSFTKNTTCDIAIYSHTELLNTSERNIIQTR